VETLDPPHKNTILVDDHLAAKVIRVSKPRLQTYIIDLAGKTKEAALYFDRVVPLTFGAGTAIEYQKRPESNFIRRISPESLYTSTGSLQPRGDYLAVFEALRVVVYHQLQEHKDDYAEVFVQKANAMISQRPELHGAPFLLPDGDSFPASSDTSTEFLVALTSLSLVDAEKASWDQILEFRKDEKSRMALRRLQIFALKEYSGKDKAFIEDDLLLRIEEYNNVVRDWGFETRIATLSNLLNSKVLLGGIGGAVLSCLFGTHWVAAASAATGITVELGNIAIDLTKRRYSLASLRRDHPLSFIITAQTRLSASKAGT
jgi:hypothetical protein